MIINKDGDGILLFHVDRFLLEYPNYAKIMADAVVFYVKDASPISPPKIQRRYYVRYEVADAIVKSLKAAKAVRHMHEPVRDEIWLFSDQAELLADYIINSIGG